MNKIKWEIVYSNNSRTEVTFRAIVEGGWLYRHESTFEVQDGLAQVTSTMTFVPKGAR